MNIMNMIRLEEALARARHAGRTDAKEQIISALWPEAARPTQLANFNNLMRGKTTRYDVQTIQVICTVCGVRADWLFGLKD